MSSDTSQQIPRSSLRRTGVGWTFAVLWLVSMIAPLESLARRPFGWQQVAGLVALVVFVGSYLAATTQLRRLREANPEAQRRALAWGAVLFLCVGVMAPGAGPSALNGLVFVAAVVAMALRPVRLRVAAVVALFVLCEVLVLVVPGWHDGGYSLSVLLGGFAAGAFRMVFERNSALLAAQRELSELALRDERSRIAQDLHDILGHSLTVIAVKSELAQRLLDVDLGRARAELADLETLSRDALADVRATALGVRGVSLAGEIATARRSLASAGIIATLPTAVDDVPAPWREVFAWTVREGVTNVIRHSRAQHCWVDMTVDSIRIRDDGLGMPPGPTAGLGLSGLRARVEAVGGRLWAGPDEEGPGSVVLVRGRP